QARREGVVVTVPPARRAAQVGRDHDDAVDALHLVHPGGRAALHQLRGRRALSSTRGGEPLGISYDGAALTYEAWVVTKNAPNAENAMKFINWALQPKPQADLTKYVAFGPTNGQAPPFVD